MDHLARGALVDRCAGFDNPVGQAIAAEPRQPHQFDILGIVAMAQMPHQPPERRRRHCIIERFERVGGIYIRIFAATHLGFLGFLRPFA